MKNHVSLLRTLSSGKGCWSVFPQICGSLKKGPQNPKTSEKQYRFSS